MFFPWERSRPPSFALRYRGTAERSHGTAALEELQATGWAGREPLQPLCQGLSVSVVAFLRYSGLGHIVKTWEV